RYRHSLGGQRKVVALLHEQQIDVSLCGHIHQPFAKIDASGRGEYSSGSVTRNGTIAEIEFIKEKNIFKHHQISLV
ncbi:MAG: hypothetical protein PHE87_11255, partial [Victivallaceae bacterium]|nr:hypothetical protein [Victivallaceae bacterium]